MFLTKETSLVVLAVFVVTVAAHAVALLVTAVRGCLRK